MPTVFDAASYILHKHGPMTAMKLQKLVYYSQAWSVVWDDDVLFAADIEAWRNGPVVRSLWDTTRGNLRISSLPYGDLGRLNEAQRETIDLVLEFYGTKDAQWLSDLTHMEAPWKEAFAQGQNTVISLERMSEFYSSLAPTAYPNEQA